SVGHEGLLAVVWFLDSSTSQPEAFTCQVNSPISIRTTSLDITSREVTIMADDNPREAKRTLTIQERWAYDLGRPLTMITTPRKGRAGADETPAGEGPAEEGPAEEGRDNRFRE
ncbi:hypothetical protein, partial [Tsukamurella asaccharolytica]|uniref:hypothetical protein n=1 Tax=Tsukamurella asaccharolytica TaxID=2592067 RepID=UPI001961490D